MDSGLVPTTIGIVGNYGPIVIAGLDVEDMVTAGGHSTGGTSSTGKSAEPFRGAVQGGDDLSEDF